MGLWVTAKTLRGLWERSELKSGVLRALHSIPLNMGVPPMLSGPVLDNPGH